MTYSTPPAYYASTYLCDTCSAIVSDIKVHNAFHKRMNDPTSKTIEDLALSVRAYNILKRHGFNHVEDIVDWVNDEYAGNFFIAFSDMKNIGEKTALNICIALSKEHVFIPGLVVNEVSS